MLDNLTDRQREIFDFIAKKIRICGYGPTAREIGDIFDIHSPNGVMCHLAALEHKGLIERDRNQARGIRLTDQAKEKAGIPLLTLNEIAASGGW